MSCEGSSGLCGSDLLQGTANILYFPRQSGNPGQLENAPENSRRERTSANLDHINYSRKRQEI